MRHKCILSIVLLIVVHSTTYSQTNITYQELRQLNVHPDTYFDVLFFPVSTDSDSVKTIVTFQLNNRYLNFRKIQPSDALTDASAEFLSEIEITFDVFKVGESIKGNNNEPIPSINRTVWGKIVFAADFDETQRRDILTEGFTEFALLPGRYRVTPTIRINGVVQSARTMNTNRQRVRNNQRNSDLPNPSLPGIPFSVPDLTSVPSAFIYFLDDEEESLSLLNFGNNVHYGRDFKLIIGLKEELPAPSIHIHRLDSENQMAGEPWMRELTPSETIPTDITGVEEQDGKLLLTKKVNPASMLIYYEVHIPNHQFKNSHYLLKVVSNERTLTERKYLTRWLTMPASLLNLDVAIEMIRYSGNAEAYKELRRGNERHREEKFYAYWSKLDPTPDTDYNELMTEYYDRIDYAFMNFTTPRTPGYESDQGKLLIRMGKPDSIERILPPNGPATEVWQYGSRSFIFKATSGFGDFELVNGS